VLLGVIWPVMGVVIALGSIVYLVMTVWLSLAYVAPAARRSNAWDTRLGGALADAVSCNPGVKAFGAETREDARLARVLARWRSRTRVVWVRGPDTGTAQGVALRLRRAGGVATAVWLGWAGQATPGDVAYVLPALFVVQGYLRDVGPHVRNLQ